VLTTATCVTYEQPAPLDQYRIRTGVLNLAIPETTQAIYEIANVLTYPGATTALDDLALVRTNIPIVFNVNTQPIRIVQNINFNVPFFTVSYATNQVKHYMRALALPNGSCFNGFPGNNFPVLLPTHICSFNIAAERSQRHWQSCVGGNHPTRSPILPLENTEMVGMALVSWTVENLGCNSQTQPTINTSLQFYMAWITSKAV
jgi:hypothetical protein